MTVFTDKVKKYLPRMCNDLAITREQACGIFGNLGTETGGFTALQEKAPIIKGSRGGYGWMQWTGPRRKKYEAWCKTNNKNPALDETNYEYLILETKTDELHSLVQLRKTKTVEAATETFMKQNLRPGIPHLDNRMRYAKIADETSKLSAAEVGTATAVGGGAIVIAANTDPMVWPWVIGGAIVAALLGVWIASRIRNKATPVEPEKVNVKKGKKNV